MTETVEQVRRDLDRTDRAVADLQTARSATDIGLAKLDLRVTTAEQGISGIRRLGMWALLLLLGTIATPILKFLLSGGFNVISTQ